MTPLHFGVIAPINHFFPGKVSTGSFLLTNLWIDLGAISAWIWDHPLPGHGVGTNHDIMGAAIIFVIIGGLGYRSAAWGWGALLGAVSHILLDALVHSDMVPFDPFLKGNPLYTGQIELVSAILLPFTVWFTVQIVSRTLGSVRRLRERWSEQTEGPSA
jgi:membrane-bound metal-dependent hydrolase YbcI (DUF457 family)